MQHPQQQAQLDNPSSTGLWAIYVCLVMCHMVDPSACWEVPTGDHSPLPNLQGPQLGLPYASLCSLMLGWGSFL